MSHYIKINPDTPTITRTVNKELKHGKRIVWILVLGHRRKGMQLFTEGQFVKAQ